jgi:hypothetical protein
MEMSRKTGYKRPARGNPVIPSIRPSGASSSVQAGVQV